MRRAFLFPFLNITEVIGELGNLATTFRLHVLEPILFDVRSVIGTKIVVGFLFGAGILLILFFLCFGGIKGGFLTIFIRLKTCLYIIPFPIAVIKEGSIEVTF